MIISGNYSKITYYFLRDFFFTVDNKIPSIFNIHLKNELLENNKEIKYNLL